jgi:adiponectin receptor
MLPIFHRVGLLGWDEACHQIGAQWYLTGALSLLLGVVLFAGRFSERLSPGYFDVWGHSHQLFHICAVAGTAFHVRALVASYSYLQAHPYC